MVWWGIKKRLMGPEVVVFGPAGLTGSVRGEAGRRIVQLTMVWSVIALAGLSPWRNASAQVGAGVVAPQTTPLERLLPLPEPQSKPSLAPGAPPQLPEEDGTQVTVSSVDVDGATAYSPAEIQRFFKDVVGRPVPQRQIAEAIVRLQTQYRTDGYFLTVVRGGLVDVEGGRQLQVRVTEGFISDVKIEGDIGPAGVLVYRFLQHVTEERPVNIADVERYLLLAQDVPGVSVRTVLRPSSGEAGAVEMVAQVERKPFAAVANFDNRGSSAAGPQQLLLEGSANSFTNFGERTQLTLFNTPFNDEQVFGQLAVDGFVGSSGLKLRGYTGYSLSEPGDPLAATGFKGRLLLAGVSGSYPVIRTRPLSLSVSAAFDVSHGEIDVNGSNGERQRQSNAHLRILRFGTTIDNQDETLGLGVVAANTATVTVSKGIVGLGSSRNNDPLPARAGEVNDFVKVVGEATRLQNLFALYDYAFALKLSAGGQYARDVLPPSEKYFLGGAQFVRGFFSGEVTGDRAVGGTAELEANTTINATRFGWFDDIRAQYYFFYDTGHVWSDVPGEAQNNLESIGVGVRADLTSFFSMELEGVQRFTRRPGGENVNPESPYAVFVRATSRF
jgi:hemolysin activation/secretion protein